MASGTILAVFNKHLGNLKMTPQWAKSLRTHTEQFINKNENHAKFFGGHFLGVYPIRWLESDRESWFDDILHCDDIALEDDLHALPAVNTDWIVSSNSYNLSVMYILHAAHHSDLTMAQKESVKVDALMNLHFKFLSSLLSRRFRFESSADTEVAVFNGLSGRYHLKKYGNWRALLKSRCMDIIGPRSIHRNTIANFRDDAAIIGMINEIQTRIRDVVNRLTSELYAALEAKNKITSVSNVMTIDGEAIVKDKMKELSKYKRYIHSTISDKRSFVRPDLVSIVADAMHTLSVPRFVTTLEYMSETYGTKVIPFLPEFIDAVLIHAFEYIAKNRLRTNDLSQVITKLRAVYMASKTSNPEMLMIKDMAHAIVNSYGKERSAALAASERTAIILYVLVRTLTYQHYATNMDVGL